MNKTDPVCKYQLACTLNRLCHNTCLAFCTSQVQNLHLLQVEQSLISTCIQPWHPPLPPLLCVWPVSRSLVTRIAPTGRHPSIADIMLLHELQLTLIRSQWSVSFRLSGPGYPMLRRPPLGEDWSCQRHRRSSSVALSECAFQPVPDSAGIRAHIAAPAASSMVTGLRCRGRDGHYCLVPMNEVVGPFVPLERHLAGRAAHRLV